MLKLDNKTFKFCTKIFQNLTLVNDSCTKIFILILHIITGNTLISDLQENLF